MNAWGILIILAAILIIWLGWTGKWSNLKGAL